MSEGMKNMLQDPISVAIDPEHVQHKHWEIMEGDDDDTCNSTSTTSSFAGSNASNASSSSSLDFIEDASSSISYSSPSSSLSSPSSGPLYELSELMAQLPIKRGLSKYFQGKSQSFTSLSSVRSIEDLAKRENPCRKRMKSCKSYAGNLDSHKSYSPRATISKKASSRGSFSSSLGKRSSLLGSCRPPFPVQKN